MATIYEFSATTMQGKELSFADLEGKVILIVNTASKCGLTPQFAALEELHRKYSERGLVVLGFPCDQFAKQEFSADKDISSFCELNYGVSFQMMKKINVNGSDTHPLYVYLKSEACGFLTNSIKWNFTKFLVSRDGKTIKRYAPITKPEKLEPIIQKLLEA